MTSPSPASARTTTLPFPALVGLDLAQQALMLLSVDPQLRGVVLTAGAGTGKSSLARGMPSLLNERSPFVELPTSVDVENLLGGLNLDATLRTGQLVMQAGVLARADGGVVYIDGLNLLTDRSANLLLSVLDQGEVRAEREGVSVRSPARFSLIASYDPAEGVPRQHLLDRVGLIVPLPDRQDVAERSRVIEHNLRHTERSWADEVQFTEGLVQTAREQLASVQISDAQLRALSVTALQYGVQGHRVDLFAERTARAAAALNLRDAVEDDDVQLAVRLVILPRATRVPESPPDPTPPPPPPPEPSEPDSSEPDGQESMPEQLAPPPDQILDALDNALPAALDDLPFQTLRRGRTGSRGSTEGKRGRHIRSVPGDARRERIDIVATLRSAAPWQPYRRDQQPSDAPARKVYLESSDIRVKHYRSKAGALFCFAVDASGSMALHRMRQAKGAVHTLLQQAYVNRDRIALIAFRGGEAELLLSPTQSVELAKRALDVLPTGGGTPLASALLLADEVAQQAATRGIFQTVLVLLTDGRANIPLREGEDAQQELHTIGRHVAESNVQVIVVDTKRNYLSRGEASTLAESLGAEYAYLPNASGEAIAELATAAAERPERA
ncbi:MAG: magnesium chelatase ATPase subunit D [Pseudomonadota bacterium]